MLFHVVTINKIRSELNKLPGVIQSSGHQYITLPIYGLADIIGGVKHLLLKNDTGGSISPKFKAVFIIILGVNWSYYLVELPKLHQISNKNRANNLRIHEDHQHAFTVF